MGRGQPDSESAAAYTVPADTIPATTHPETLRQDTIPLDLALRVLKCLKKSFSTLSKAKTFSKETIFGAVFHDAGLVTARDRVVLRSEWRTGGGPVVPSFKGPARPAYQGGPDRAVTLLPSRPGEFRKATKRTSLGRPGAQLRSTHSPPFLRAFRLRIGEGDGGN